MSRPFALLFLLLPSALAGCSVQIDDGQFDCSDGRCPAGWYCHDEDRRCHRTPGGQPDAPIDAVAPVDAAIDVPLAMPDTPLDAPLDAPMFPCTGGSGTVCMRGSTPGLCCGGSCIDPNGDPAHCGRCGIACGDATPRCLAGDCVECLPGLDACSDSLDCTDDECDPSGACRNTSTCAFTPGTQDCRSGAVCTATGCQFTYLADGSACINPVAPARDRCANDHCFDINSCGTGPLVCCSTANADCVTLDLCDSGC